MSRLLRVVDGDRWDFGDDLADWTARDDLPAAAVSDLKASATNKLSVWVIEDDGSNLDRILAAIASTRPRIDQLDARIVEAGDVSALGVKSESSPGQTKDREANRRWHLNLVELTYQQLGALVRLLASRATPLERDDREVTELIVASVKAGYIRLEDLRPPPGPGESSVWHVINEAIKGEA